MLEDELATLEERFTLRSEKLNIQEKHQQALLGKGIETKRSLEEGLAQARPNFTKTPLSAHPK